MSARLQARMEANKSVPIEARLDHMAYIVKDAFSENASLKAHADAQVAALTKERDIEVERATHYRDQWQTAVQQGAALLEALTSAVVDLRAQWPTCVRLHAYDKALSQGMRK